MTPPSVTPVAVVVGRCDARDRRVVMAAAAEPRMCLRGMLKRQVLLLSGDVGLDGQEFASLFLGQKGKHISREVT